MDQGTPGEIPQRRGSALRPKGAEVGALPARKTEQKTAKVRSDINCNAALYVTPCLKNNSKLYDH